MQVRIIPKSKRAKDRINSHGNIMSLIRSDKFRGEDAFLLESLNKTAFNGTKWFGWLTVKEADIEEVDTSTVEILMDKE